MATKSNSYPPQIKYIVGNEACERFSFYGMRSILVIFMVQYLAMHEADAKANFHWFVSAGYFMTLIGGFIADRFLGKYNTIMLLSIIYCIGHGVLALFESREGLFWGLGLIAVGMGGVKSCTSAFVGDQFTEKNKHLIKGVFDIFYFTINFGSFFSTLLIPIILPKYGPAWAFGVPGILMAIATFIFWLGRHKYVNIPPTRESGTAGFLSVFFYALTHQGKRKKGQGFMEAARGKYSAAEVEGAQAALNIFKVFIAVSAFWALFDQHGSSWVLQAEKMDRDFMGMHFESSQISALNPIMVMLLIPFCAYVLYPAIEKMGLKMTPLRRMSGGMIVAALSFVSVALIQTALDNGQTVNVAWQFVPYLVLSLSEVMISVTGLEFAYTQAPLSMKGTIMGFWFLTIVAGNMITAYVSQINVFQGATYFYFFALLMAALSGVFIFAASRYKTRDYFEKA